MRALQHFLVQGRLEHCGFACLLASFRAWRIVASVRALQHFLVQGCLKACGHGALAPWACLLTCLFSGPILRHDFGHKNETDPKMNMFETTRTKTVSFLWCLQIAFGVSVLFVHELRTTRNKAQGCQTRHGSENRALFNALFYWALILPTLRAFGRKFGAASGPSPDVKFGAMPMRLGGRI